MTVCIIIVILSTFNCSILVYSIGHVVSAHILLVVVFLRTAHVRNSGVDYGKERVEEV